MKWQGVFPAMTTAFNADLSIDHKAVAKQTSWLISNGCKGIVALGSLGESATLSFDEKVAILRTCAGALADKAPLVAGIASLSTMEAIELAKAAQKAGCSGLMILPPYVYSTDWREMKAHVQAVLRATNLSCMLYNNPIAYKTDFIPEQISELAREHENLHAVKDSSGDARRITGIKALCGDRLALYVGLDDMVVEGVRAGATGWIAGLVNALPRESVALFDLVSSGQTDKTAALYRWFLPLLRMDTVPKFVQLIKLVQKELGTGTEYVRPPRLVLEGSEREEAMRVIRHVMKERSTLNTSA